MTVVLYSASILLHIQGEIIDSEFLQEVLKLQHYLLLTKSSVQNIQVPASDGLAGAVCHFHWI